MTDPIVPLPPTPVLETARLILRPIGEHDIPAIQRIFDDWRVVEHLHAGIPWPYPEDGAATNMAQCMDERAGGMKAFWAITLKGSDELRGRIDLWAFDPERRDSRGFWLDPELWGQGLMTEAADAVTDYALRTLGWPYLYLTNSLANRRSDRVKEKQGATRAYVEPHDFMTGPGERQVWLLTRDAWLAREAT
jgi:[ribosomal protein S5]-alanine N-acetyltransferase